VPCVSSRLPKLGILGSGRYVLCKDLWPRVGTRVEWSALPILFESLLVFRHTLWFLWTTGAMSDSSFSGNPNAPIPGAGGTVTEAGLLAIIWVFFSTATCFVALRLIVRFRQNRFFLYDDYWMMLAWCTLLTMVVLQMEQRYPLWYVTYLTAGRVGFDQYSLGIIEQLTRWQFPIIKLFWTVLWSVKASFMAVFFRLVKPFPVLRRLWYCVAVFAFLAFVGCWLVSAFTCSPPSDYFKPGMPLRLCVHIDRINLHSAQEHAANHMNSGCKGSTLSTRRASTSPPTS